MRTVQLAKERRVDSTCCNRRPQWRKDVLEQHHEARKLLQIKQVHIIINEPWNDEVNPSHVPWRRSCFSLYFVLVNRSVATTRSLEDSQESGDGSLRFFLGGYFFVVYIYIYNCIYIYIYIPRFKREDDSCSIDQTTAYQSSFHVEVLGLVSWPPLWDWSTRLACVLRFAGWSYLSEIAFLFWLHQFWFHRSFSFVLVWSQIIIWYLFCIQLGFALGPYLFCFLLFFPSDP